MATHLVNSFIGIIVFGSKFKIKSDEAEAYLLKIKNETSIDLHYPSHTIKHQC